MNEQEFKLVIIGGGILGTSLAFWLSTLFSGSEIALLEKEPQVGAHATDRNTGVLHRPFYLDPEKKRVFARSSQLSYALWKDFAAEYDLPWNQVGTLELALTPEDYAVLEKYRRWSLENGMQEEEVELYPADRVKELEPHVKSHGGLLAKTDTAVDFKAFAGQLKTLAQENGLEILTAHQAVKVTKIEDGIIINCQNKKTLKADFVINCAGGEAIDIAHSLGAAKEYTDLHFRGEYWLVDPTFSHLAGHNIYTVPRYKDYPFLDPHWIIRWNGQVEIGPNAVIVTGPNTYEGLTEGFWSVIQKLFERPFLNKLRLLINPEFISLAMAEWQSSFSRKNMTRRMQQFMPELGVDSLLKAGKAGVRSQLVDKKGRFIKEALLLYAPDSFHILNFNSPGASGASAFTAYLLKQLMEKGKLDDLTLRDKPLESLWNFDRVISDLGL